MAKFAKWVGGTLGWVFGGPIGGLIGFTLGSMVDEIGGKGIQPGGGPQMAYSSSSAQGDFAVSLLVLTAAVMKGDGPVT